MINHRLIVDAQIFERFPEYQALIVYAEGIRNFPSTAESEALLRAAEQACRATLTSDTLLQHPHINAWREAYRLFGANPKKYPSSIEALLRRTLKGQDLPSINGLVDLYNAVSLKYLLPAGGEDLDTLVSDLHLTYAQGNEPFVTMQDGQEQAIYPEAGEVIWADTAGVTCRRWNWRQGRRTQLTEGTQAAYFVLDRLAPYPSETLLAAGEELKAHLLRWFPACTITIEVLQKV
ncbi:B3/B4 domain-containing protein [Dictyobacter alpinus]|uniref:B3/B4 domain-containing protein n=1 Tax=Dictyobacter alpinus TaxID=2014873 RepID=UPI001C3FB70B|nr:phenylalanine--tRNA ligase beta subunit-related protein [Dictyobacter alpinus]